MLCKLETLNQISGGPKITAGDSENSSVWGGKSLIRRGRNRYLRFERSQAA